MQPVISHYSPTRRTSTIRRRPDHIAQNQGRIYRYQLQAGNTLTARIEPVNGDPDLYVWAPDYQTRPPWVSNLSDAVDMVSFTAPVSRNLSGRSIWIYNSGYRLNVDVTPADNLEAAQVNGVDPDKPQAPTSQLCR